MLRREQSRQRDLKRKTGTVGRIAEMPMMWDRLKLSQKQDDEGVRLDLGYNNHNAPKRGGYSYSIKGGPPPPRPPREFLESHLETAAPRAVIQEPPPRNPARIKVRTSTYRPPSSVYSQDTQAQPPVPNYTVTVATKYGYRYGGGAEEISPPSSPEPDSEGVKRFLPGDVSPIEEDDHPATVPHHQQSAARRNAAQDGYSRQEQTPTPETGRQSPRRAPNSRGGATSIPMMRRERRKQSGAVMRETNSNSRDLPPRETGPAGREPPRWDPLTGERTTAGRPSQVNSAELAQGLGITATAWASPQTSPTQVPPSFTDRVRRIAKKAAAGREREPQHDTDPAAGAFTSTRPGWRGASGRTAIVEPVRDTPEVAPLRIPEKNSRRTFTPVQAARPKPDLSLGGVPRRGQTPPISPPATEAPTARTGLRETSHDIVRTPSQQISPTAYLHSENAQSYPSPPLSSTPLGSGDAPAMAARELARDAVPNLAALPSPKFNNSSHEVNVIRRKPPPVHAHHQHQDSASSVYSQSPQGPLHTSPLHIPDIAPPATLAANNGTYVQPPSRFSITTYATSNTGTTRDDGDDLVDEDQPPVPSLPVGLHHRGKIGSSSDDSPVTSPIDQFMTSPFTTHTEQLKMVNPALARAQAIERPSSRASDINKSLPPAPPEGEAQDRVGLLNAQLRALANRRININRSITQMTEMMPTDKLMNSEEVIRKREIEKKKVEALKQELSEVQREEYELGLKLHRAYKRLDRDNEFEPTGLWVRRVTN
ncbi:hypothetical protein QBC36DRAFT_15816 [Triangularia setosa]|uniref:Uncharacterized protein n=1 Tax=Triangularia setosa TaxID=2587417 RepID=A0AAN7A7E3_9PEZI|nr:hypothetical protein QBC36DRAFT_15816 [Podospora setosa]